MEMRRKKVFLIEDNIKINYTNKINNRYVYRWREKNEMCQLYMNKSIIIIES